MAAALTLALSLVLLWSSTAVDGASIAADQVCPRVDKTVQATPKEIRIAAFNIQRFGENKMKQRDVIDVIIRILIRYDVVLVEEIVDKREQALQELVAELNSHCNKNVYEYRISPRVGRTSAKEQYAYIFRNDAVKAVNSFLYIDEGDIFEREPFIATFTVNGRQSKADLQNFTMIGIHTKPTSAKEELQNLHKSVEFVEKKNLKNIIILGDFNGDCDYVRKKHWPTIPLWNQTSKYEWLIGTGVDTTTKNTVCAYDRIVVTGDILKKSVVNGKAEVFRYDAEFQLNPELVTKISDHYPVEVLLKIKSS